MIDVLLTAALLATQQAPAAEAPAPVKMTCPIGGASFEYSPPAPAMVSGLRPDGKPYSSVRYPPALPECPDNGLILYKDYDKAEVAKLEAMLSGGEYQTLRQETPYYRAYRLMRELGESPDRSLWVLLQATWEAEDKPELRARYQSELVEEAAKIPPRPDDLEWIGMQVRIVNALRELGRFDEAKATLAALPLASLDVTVPEAGKATDAEIRAARARHSWFTILKQLQAAVDRRDASMEPLEMIPRTVALARCDGQTEGLSDSDRAFCSAHASAKPATAPVDPAAELEALRKSREESGR